MNPEYVLGKSGKYPQLECNDAIVKCLAVYGFGDCIDFCKHNKDGSTFGSNFGLGNIGCYSELKPYTRLMDVPRQDVKKLAARIFETLYMKRRKDEVVYAVPPKVNPDNRRYKQILEELIALQRTEGRLVASKQLVFPEISDEEEACRDLW